MMVRIKNIHWCKREILKLAELWCIRTRKRLGAANEGNMWWTFIPTWNENIEHWLQDFSSGRHQFSPMSQYEFKDGVARVWTYLDRLIMHLILKIIKPTLKHIISPLCLHLSGPSVIKSVTARIRAALITERFNYVMRIDIHSYYASINHRVLIKQVTEHFADPIVLKYLEDVITIAVDNGGNVFLPTQGIPLQSTLSPFFGALYLTALDKAFTKRKGIFYLRFVDDVIILIENKRQYAKARKRLFEVLKALRLKISPHKTRMGALKAGFHFLGVNFEVARTPQSKTQVIAVDVHPRTCRRALNNVVALRTYAVHPAHIQRYLIRWATWWHTTVNGLRTKDLIYKWICCAEVEKPTDAWIGRGLLIGQRRTYSL